jgi:hypothetical protein
LVGRGFGCMTELRVSVIQAKPRLHGIYPRAVVTPYRPEGETANSWDRQLYISSAVVV